MNTMNTIVNKVMGFQVPLGYAVKVINFTGRDITFSGTTLPSEGRKPLFLQVTKTNPRFTKSGVQVFDASYNLPDNFCELVGNAIGILVPSLTAFSIGSSITANGRDVEVYFPNTNPGFIGRDEKGAIDFNTHTTLQQVKKDLVCDSVCECSICLGKPNTYEIDQNTYEIDQNTYEIDQIFVYLPHPVKIVDKVGTELQTIPKSGDDGRSVFSVIEERFIETVDGPLHVVIGTNSVPTFAVPTSKTHDGVVISANLYAILKDNNVVGNPTKMIQTFGRDNFSLLVVDNDTMVRDGPRIVGAQNFLCVDIVPKI